MQTNDVLYHPHQKRVYIGKMQKNLMGRSHLTHLAALFLGILILPCAALALDTSQEEKQCLDIGFKRKTPAFANCVLELIDRRGSSIQSAQDPDDATCRKYGFKPKTDNYAICRQQIDLARQQAQQQQAQYAQQRAEYEAQLAEQKRERDRQKGMAMLNLGLGMMSGKYNASNGYGTLPPAPTPPQNMNRTYILPGGKMMNCNTSGSVTTCF